MSKEGVLKQELVDSLEESLDEQQQITLNEKDDDANSHPVSARKVTITYADRSSTEQIRHHSHYVSTKPYIEYKWEKAFYHGHLIAVHMSGKIFAYCLQTHHTGKVRVSKEDTSRDSDSRCLMKEFETQLVDIDFAHVPDAYYIACMEQNGWCSVFSILDEKPMTYEFLVKIRVNDDVPQPGISCRAIWCVHVPEKGRRTYFPDAHDPSNRLIITTNGEGIVVSIPVVQTAASDSKKEVVASAAGIKGVAHTPGGAKIWDGKISPDGVVLCLAREDGNVHFYQCVIEKGDKLVEEAANLVYTWVPHDGRPVHTIHFFDDFSPSTKQDQFWMFALSGSEYGRQFRIWNCQHWYCLQTINIEPSPSLPSELPMLQAALDPTGGYLILGDSNRNLVMYLRVDKNEVKRVASVTVVNEFSVGSSILGLVAVDLKRVHSPALSQSEAEENGFESRLVTLHANQLQQMSISYVGEQLPIRDFDDDSLGDPFAVLESRKNASDGDPLQQNGEQKIRKKKPKKTRETWTRENFTTLDDVPTPVLPSLPDFATNGNDADYKSTAPAQSPEPCRSPEFVLKPPSDFDGFSTLRRDRPHQDTPTYVKDLPDLDDKLSVPDELDTLSIKQENYSPKSSFSRDTYADTLNGLSSMGLGVLPHGLSNDNIRPGRSSDQEMNSGRSAADERLEKLEKILETITTVAEKQSEMVLQFRGVLEGLSATMEGLKVSESRAGSGDRDEVFKQGFTAIVQSIRPLQEMQGLEGRLSGMIEGSGKSLENNVTKEIKSQMGQNLQKALKPIGEKLSTDLMGRMNGLDGVVRTRIDETLRSPQFVGALVQVVAPQFAEIAKQTVQDVVANQMVKSYQDIMNGSLNTLNQTFLNGTKEYLNQVNRALEGHFNRIDAAFEERLCRVEQNTDRTTLTAVQSVSSKLLQEVQDVVNQNSEQFLDKVLQNLSAQISQNVITSVKSEMREQQTVMHETIQALRSGIATPGGAAANQVQQQQKPQQTMQDIKSALAKKDYNTAFRTALSASDLAVVLYVCEKATVKEVFDKPNTLEMPVLCSLIQQLAVDITSRTELKVEFLEEALLAIQFDDLEPHSFKYMRTVLEDVTSRLKKFLQTNPKHPLSRNIRILANQTSLQLNQMSTHQGNK